MALHPLLGPRLAGTEPAWDRAERLEAELDEARALLRRLLDAEDRIGLVFPVMDDARAFLARRRRERH